MQATIRNDTPHILRLQGSDNQEIVLAPLEQRTMKDLSAFELSQASRAALLSHWEEPLSDIFENVLGMALGLAMVLAIACGIIASREPWFGITAEYWPRYVWGAGALVEALIVAARVIFLTRSSRHVVRFLTQTVSLCAILAIGIGLPVATVYYFGDLQMLLRAQSQELFVRLLQLAFIGSASLLPVLLYFLFDRYQLSTVRHRLYRDLFRLDRNLKTRSEIDARFGSQIREAYGPENEGRGRIAPGTSWPVVVCAFVITLGWLSVFRPVGKVDPAQLANPLSIAPAAWSFGFLGAYFFGLQLIARRYARGELKPKAYGYITVRILTVGVLTWVLETMFSAESAVMLVLAFLVGVLPEEFFTLVREQLRGRFAERIVPEIEKHPLTRLEGIDLYDRARLEQEGIVNVEGLAHHELIQLVLGASVPVPRLVDWIDQAILYLHVFQDDGDRARQKLRDYGIRTATDLLTCWDAAEARGELDDFKKLLGGDVKPFRLEVIRDALRDDEWLNRVQDWRKDSPPAERVVTAMPHSVAALVRWSDSLRKQGRDREALQSLKQALAMHDDAGAHARAALILATSIDPSLRDTTGSREHAKRAFELEPSSLKVLLLLIEVFEANDDGPDALRVYEAAINAIGSPGPDKEKEALLKDLKKRQAALGMKLGADASAAALAATGKSPIAAALKQLVAKQGDNDRGPGKRDSD